MIGIDRPQPPPPLLRCGPLVRRVTSDAAVIWVELGESLEVEVSYRAVWPNRYGREQWARGYPVRVGDGYYAWVACRFLLPDTWYEYEVRVRGLTGGWRTVWPDYALSTIRRPSLFRTLPSWSLDKLRIAYGSCRLGDSIRGPADRGVDALRVLAEQMDRRWSYRTTEWPHLFLYLGDQVYVDDLDDVTRVELRRVERSVSLPGRASTLRQYAAVYRAAWTGTPPVRWLLSVLPSMMIFDDHEIADDWNITQEWVAAHQSLSWRRTERDGLLAYWIYQGAGNLAPEQWSGDERMRPLVPAIRHLNDDVTPQLTRLFEGYQAGTRRTDWNCSFDAAGVRVVLADTRTRRKLTGRREIVDDTGWQLLDAAVKGTHRRNVLLVLPGPLLTQHRLHDLLSIAGAYLEEGSAPVDPMRRGPGLEAVLWLQAVLPGLVRKFVRDEAVDGPDAELWASFPTSFDRMLGLLEDLYEGRGTPAKNAVTILSGDVHHSFVIRGELTDTSRRSRFLNITCSPLRRVDGSEDKKRKVYSGFFWYELLRLFGTPPFVAEQRRRCHWYPLSGPDGKHLSQRPLDSWAFWGSLVGWIDFQGSRLRYRLDRVDGEVFSPVIQGSG